LSSLTDHKRIFAVAGEPSGDVHAAFVLQELKNSAPDVEIRGFGGKHMAAAGMHLLEDLAANAIMGLFPVIKSLPKIRQWFAKAVQDLKENRPDVVLLVDYPGFNLRLAKIAKKMGIPVIYYISPQVWAWNQKRIHKIRQVVDLMIVILPFEKSFYDKHGVEVYYPGHPLSDRLSKSPADQKTADALRSGPGRPLIGLFPGSRPHVVQSLAPEFIRCAVEMTKKPELSNSHFLIAAADERIAEMIRLVPGLNQISHDVVANRSFEIMAACDVALTTSGTTTIELAGHLKPMILAYKVSPVLLFLGRMFVKVPHIGLVNLIAEKGIIHEHIGTKKLWRELAKDLGDLALNEKRQDEIRDELKEVVARLESPGSYRRTANRILEFMAG
jgi:lipid-A-disaccharide synthase